MFAAGTRSAVCSRISRVSSGRSVDRRARVARGADHQRRGAGGLAGVLRPGRALHRDRALAAVLGGVGAAEVGARPADRGARAADCAGRAGRAPPAPAATSLPASWPSPIGVRHGALDQHRVAVVGGVVVVAGVEVVTRVGLDDAVVVGVLRGLPRRRPSGRWCRSRPRSPRRRCRWRRASPSRSRCRRRRRCPRSGSAGTGSGGRRRSSPRRRCPRSAASPARPDAVVRGGEVARGVVGVVVVVEEVPARDVVDEAVGVGVGAVGEGGDQVLGGDLPRRPVRPGHAAHPGVVGVVVDVERAVAVAVVATPPPEPSARLG